jgi:hypothetical protein
MRITEKQIRQIIREEILREANNTASTGDAVDGGASVDKLKAMIAKFPTLEPVFKQIDTKKEIAGMIQGIVDYAISTGGVSRDEVLGALNTALSAAKKG